jgi:CheY-like chemotaxis protein
MAYDLTKPVLVVDDYNTMIRIMHNLLKQLGFEQVDDANDGSTALAKLRKRDYGLVISDWNMEPMTGFALLQEMRADPFARRNSIHYGDGGIQDRKRDRSEEGRCVELHRQAVQRANAQEQDRRRLW